MRPSLRHAGAAALPAVLALVAGLQGTGLAQDATEEPAATPSPFCSVLTTQEASTALGVAITLGSSSATDCSYDSDFRTSDVSLIASRADGPIDGDPHSDYPDGVALVIADHAGWYVPADTILFLDEQAHDQLFVLQLFGSPPDSVDIQAALTTLAADALPRLPSIPLPAAPSVYPEPSYLGSPELEALMPRTVDGVSLEVQTRSGADIRAGTDPADTEAQDLLGQLQAIAASQGRTLDDLAIGYGSLSTDDAYVDIVAVRIAGADITKVASELLPLMLPDLLDPRTTPTTIGGRAAFLVTDGPPPTPGASIDPYDPVSTMIPSGDVVWFVSGVEPALRDTIAQLR